MVPALRAVRLGTLFVGAALLLSPLYATLAQSVSTDSVVSLSVGLLAAHLALWDYGFDGRVASRATSASLACTLLATALCASRAGTPGASFAQVGGAGTAGR